MNFQEAKNALQKYFGYDHFRPNQAEIIESIYEGKDALVIMPTGGGKSICYQIPGITMPGTCLVVSPLISLMKDQVEALKANGIAAAFINSSQPSREQQVVENDLFNGALDLIYVSPEKLTSQGFLPLLKRSKINLFAIDEAHCISAWGHDFRPEYAQLKFLKKQFPQVPVVALTATADKITRHDIIDQLGLDFPQQFIASFDRPNLSLTVRPGQQKLQQIVDFLKDRKKQPGIIYCLSRKSTEQVAAKLLARGIKADFYHAGMVSRDRSKVQEDFLNDKITVVCATIAFGMGIDKSNVRWVIHYNLPKNIESFYQEIGRAGRDGAPADTLLFYSFYDVMVLREILGKNESDNTEIQLTKLERMQQYAEALICRRQILLNYFNEPYEGACGNCDICQSPPQYFDATVIAQKALSAMVRLKEKVGMNLLIDVLRGSGRKEIISRGLDKIKTFGAGRDLSQAAWKYYLTQLINKGIIEVAYDDHQCLKKTVAGDHILFKDKKVELVQFLSAKKAKEQREPVRKKTQKEIVSEGLFERLRKLRLEISRKKGVPPYIVFSDATLQEMAAEQPITDADMRGITGVGEQKMREYGGPFATAIKEHLREQASQGLKVTGATYLETLHLLQAGLSVEAIANQREVQVKTIYSHIIYLYENNEPIDLYKFVSKSTIQLVRQILPGIDRPIKLKPIYERLNEEVPYHEIRLALAYLRKAGEV